MNIGLGDLGGDSLFARKEEQKVLIELVEMLSVKTDRRNCYLSARVKFHLVDTAVAGKHLILRAHRLTQDILFYRDRLFGKRGLVDGPTF